MAIKYLCDICGKEIPVGKIPSRIKFNKQIISIIFGFNDNFIDTKICNECIIKIFKNCEVLDNNGEVVK